MNILEIIVIALIASLAMAFTFKLFEFNRKHILQTLGQTISRENPIVAGIAIHILVATLSAFLYTSLWSYFRIEGLLTSVIFGLGIGAIHGFIISFWMIIGISEHHPFNNVRGRGFDFAGSAIAAHIIFGLIVGILLSYFGTELPQIVEFAQTMDAPMMPRITF